GHARRKATAVGEMDARRGLGGHLVNRLRQRERFALAYVTAEHAWEGAEPAWMRMAAARRAVGREGAAVAADHSLRVGEDAVEIVFAHREPNHADAAAASLQQRHGHGVRIHVQTLRIGAETRTLGGPVARVGDVGDHHAVPAADQRDVRERFLLDTLRRCRERFLLDLVRGLRIGESPEKSGSAAVATPYREEVGESRLVGDVWIAIESRVASSGARGGYSCERGVEFSPVARTLRLEMRDLQRTSGAARDGDRLVDRLDEAVVFVAHVRRVRQSSRREWLTESNELVAWCEGAGRILESRGRAARAVGDRGT